MAHCASGLDPGVGARQGSGARFSKVPVTFHGLLTLVIWWETNWDWGCERHCLVFTPFWEVWPTRQPLSDRVVVGCYYWNFVLNQKYWSRGTYHPIWPFSIYLNSYLAARSWENKTKEMYYSSLSFNMISFVLFPQASQPSMNFNLSELVF